MTAAAAPKRYRVTGMMIVAKTMTLDGIRYVNLMQGAPLPPDVEQAHIDHLLRHDLIEEVTAPAPPPPPEPEKPKGDPAPPAPVTTVTQVTEEKTVTTTPADKPEERPPTPPGRGARTHRP